MEKILIDFSAPYEEQLEANSGYQAGRLSDTTGVPYARYDTGTRVQLDEVLDHEEKEEPVEKRRPFGKKEEETKEEDTSEEESSDENEEADQEESNDEDSGEEESSDEETDQEETEE